MSYLLRHKKTGARIALLEKMMMITRYSVLDSERHLQIPQVFHTFIEHTVLCGSKEFPVKGHL